MAGEELLIGSIAANSPEVQKSQEESLQHAREFAADVKSRGFLDAMRSRREAKGPRGR
jgi:hypothetical protein